MMNSRVYQTLLMLFIVGVMALVFNVQSFGAPISSFTSATTTVGGPITSDTNWTKANSPYVVSSSVLVSEGVKLTIEPGVVVKFDLLKGLQVDGQLVARGAEDEWIVFTSMKDDTVGGDSNGDGDLTSAAPGDWAFIFFTDLSVDATFDADGRYVDGAILEYCKIMHGGSAGTHGAVRIDLSAPLLNYTIVSDSADRGIYVSQGTPKIVNSSINYNSQEGLYMYGWPSGYEVTIVGNTVTNNLGQGIYACAYGGIGIISNNTIANNGGRGITVGGYGGAFSITDNIIRFNSGGGIYVFEASAVITNNIITYNSFLPGYYWSVGAGMYVTTGYNAYQTITNNIIAYNTASQGGALYLSSTSDGSTLTVSDNSIIANTATTDSIVHIYSDTDSLDMFTHNLLTQNRDDSTISTSIKVDGLPIINYNNFFSNFHSYEVYNTNEVGSSHVDSKNDWWGTSNAAEIQAKIYDWSDDITKGIVDYTPYSSSIRTDTPISPPLSLSITPGTASYTLSWNPNPEPDIAGYKIYYDSDSDHPYKYSIDVGNVTTYTLTGLPPNAIFFTVTAYDADADGNNDLFEGHESWYAVEAIADYAPPTIETPSRIPAGDVQPYESVNVSVIVTDAESGVRNVTLLYTIDNGTTWTSILMNRYRSTSLYEATIPSYWWGIIVKYKIVAYDYARNNSTKEGTDPYYTYQVITEFPSLIVMPLFMVITLLAVIVQRRERSKQKTKKK